MDNLKNKAIKSVFWIAIVRWFGQFISWIVTIVLIRILSPEDYGLIGLAIAYNAIIYIFYDFSMGEAVLQKKDLSETDIYTAFWVCITFSLLLYLLTWFLVPFLSDFFSNSELIPIIRVLSISSIFYSIKEIPNRLLAREFEFKKRSFFELIANFSNLFTSLLLALNGYGVWSLVFGEIIRSIVLAFLILLYLKWIPRLCFSISSANQLLKYGIPVTGYYILDYISTKSDSLIIGKLLGQNILGYYSVALSISRIPVYKGIQIIQQVLFPIFSKIQDNKEESVWYYYKIIYIVSVFFCPVFFGMFSVSEEIIYLILSPKWLPCLFILKLFCFIGLLSSYTGIFLVILKSRGKANSAFRYSVISAIFLPITFIISSYLGMDAIGVGWVIVFPVLFFYLWKQVAIELDISIYKSIIIMFNSLLGSIIMVFAVLIFKLIVFNNDISMINFIILIGIGAITYIGYFFLFSRHTFHDIALIYHKLKS